MSGRSNRSRWAMPLAGCIILTVAVAGMESGDIRTRSKATSVSAFAGEMLAVHNAIRAEAKLPPLRWSAELATYSQRWANTLVAKNLAIHNPKSPYGENIFISGMRFTPSMVVREWASESKDYDYRTNACRTDCGHYTQLVWRDTLRVGCAVARSARRDVWVCSYDPPGNFEGEWPY